MSKLLLSAAWPFSFIMVRMLVSAAAVPAKDQQVLQGFCIFTGVTTPLSRRSNLAGYADFDDESDFCSLAGAEPELLAPPHATSTDARTSAAAVHSSISGFLMPFPFPWRDHGD